MMFNGSILAMIGVPGVLEILLLGLFVGVVVLVVASLTVASKKNSQLHSNNLVPCPDCGHAVSTRAQTCPQCGAPLKPSA